MLREVRIRGADSEGERAQWGERKILEGRSGTKKPELIKPSSCHESTPLLLLADSRKKPVCVGCVLANL